MPDLSGLASPALAVVPTQGHQQRRHSFVTNEKGHEPYDLVADSWPMIAVRRGETRPLSSQQHTNQIVGDQ